MNKELPNGRVVDICVYSHCKNLAAYQFTHNRSFTICRDCMGDPDKVKNATPIRLYHKDRPLNSEQLTLRQVLMALGLYWHVFSDKSVTVADKACYKTTDQNDKEWVSFAEADLLLPCCSAKGVWHQLRKDKLIT